MKEFSKFQIATLKRSAQNVNPIVTKKNKIKAQIDALNEEYNQLQAQQDAWEAAIKEMTGGYTTEDLVEKVVETTDKSDKDGKPIKVTKYVLKYPETIIPPTEVSVEETVSTDAVDDTEKAPEVEVKAGEEAPINPIAQFTEEDKNDIPFMG